MWRTDQSPLDETLMIHDGRLPAMTPPLALVRPVSSGCRDVCAQCSRDRDTYTAPLSSSEKRGGLLPSDNAPLPSPHVWLLDFLVLLSGNQRGTRHSSHTQSSSCVWVFDCHISCLLNFGC